MNDPRDLATQLAPPTQKHTRLRQATVASVASNTVGLQFAGSGTVILGVTCLGSYVPAVNDVVQVLQAGSDLLVLGNQRPGRTPIKIEQAGITVNGIGTVDTAVTGTATFTVTVPSQLWIVGSLDGQVTTAGAATLQGFLYVDGGAQVAYADVGVGTVMRATACQTWVVALAAGSHTVLMKASKSAAAGVVNVTNNTRIAGLVIPD